MCARDGPKPKGKGQRSQGTMRKHGQILGHSWAVHSFRSGCCLTGPFRSGLIFCQANLPVPNRSRSMGIWEKSVEALVWFRKPSVRSKIPFEFPLLQEFSPHEHNAGNQNSERRCPISGLILFNAPLVPGGYGNHGDFPGRPPTCPWRSRVHRPERTTGCRGDRCRRDGGRRHRHDLEARRRTWWLFAMSTNGKPPARSQRIRRRVGTKISER